MLCFVLLRIIYIESLMTNMKMKSGEVDVLILTGHIVELVLLAVCLNNFYLLQYFQVIFYGFG